MEKNKLLGVLLIGLCLSMMFVYFNNKINSLETKINDYYDEEIENIYTAIGRQADLIKAIKK